MIGTEVLLPFAFALEAELHFLCGLLQYFGGRLFGSSLAPASNSTVDVGWDFPIFLRQLDDLHIPIQFGFLL